MADEQQTPPNLAPQPSELELLKQRAKLMGIEHSNNISVETLRQKIEAKLKGESEQETPATPPVPTPSEPNPFAMAARDEADTIEKVLAVEEPVRQLSLREWIIQEQMKLVRVRITNLDPKKKDLPGEIITVANEHLGTVRKFVPFGEATENGYHIPMCIYNFLKSRKFTHVQTKRGQNTHQIIVTNRDVAEFSLEVLEPLTREEIRELATAQLAAGSVDG
jgi:hypothetical protein